MNFNQFYFKCIWDPVHYLYEIIESNLISVISSLYWDFKNKVLIPNIK